MCKIKSKVPYFYSPALLFPSISIPHGATTVNSLLCILLNAFIFWFLFFFPSILLTYSLLLSALFMLSFKQPLYSSYLLVSLGNLTSISVRIMCKFRQNNFWAKASHLWLKNINFTGYLFCFAFRLVVSLLKLPPGTYRVR